MSFVMDQDSSPATPQRRRWPWVLVAVLVLAAVATGAFLLGRDGGSGQAGPSPAPVAPPAPQGPLGQVRWQQAAGSIVPISAEHGPREQVGGVARGYTHDEPGAVSAAINISQRAAGTAGPGTYQAVIEQQTFGNTTYELRRLSAESSSSSPGEILPSQWWYQIKAGDPNSDLVQVSLLAATPQSQGMGGYVGLDVTLAWRDGDWKMQVPSAEPSLAMQTAGHTPLGSAGP